MNGFPFDSSTSVPIFGFWRMAIFLPLLAKAAGAYARPGLRHDDAREGGVPLSTRSTDVTEDSFRGGNKHWKLAFAISIAFIGTSLAIAVILWVYRRRRQLRRARKPSKVRGKLGLRKKPKVLHGLERLSRLSTVSLKPGVNDDQAWTASITPAAMGFGSRKPSSIALPSFNPSDNNYLHQIPSIDTTSFPHSPARYRSPISPPISPLTPSTRPSTLSSAISPVSVATMSNSLSPLPSTTACIRTPGFTEFSFFETPVSPAVPIADIPFDGRAG